MYSSKEQSWQQGGPQKQLPACRYQNYLSNIGCSIFLCVNLSTDSTTAPTALHHWVGRRRRDFILPGVGARATLLQTLDLFCLLLKESCFSESESWYSQIPVTAQLTSNLLQYQQKNKQVSSKWGVGWSTQQSKIREKSLQRGYSVPQHTLLVATPLVLLEPSHMKSDKDFLSTRPLTKKVLGPEGNKSVIFYFFTHFTHSLTLQNIFQIQINLAVRKLFRIKVTYTKKKKTTTP